MSALRVLQIAATPRTFGPAGETSSAGLYALAENNAGDRSLWYLNEDAPGVWYPLPPIPDPGVARVD